MARLLDDPAIRGGFDHAVAELDGSLQIWDWSERSAFDEGSALLRAGLAGRGVERFRDAARLEGHPTEVAFQQLLDQVEAKAPAAAPSGSAVAEAPPPDLAFGTLFEVVDPNALIRDSGLQTTGGAIPEGTTVWMLRSNGPYAQVITPPSEVYRISEADGVWTAVSNLGGAGRDVGLGNERSDAADLPEAERIRGLLPKGRKPGESPYTWSFGSIQTEMNDIRLHRTLLDKVARMLDWAIHNDMVTGNIVGSSGMRSPAKAHRWCVAWEIQYRPGRIYMTLDRLKALPGGKDRDGNLWYRQSWGDSWAPIRANAHTIRKSEAKAAAGYPKGDARRAPLDVGGAAPGVSHHCSGGAVDITIPWRAPGAHASTGKTDIWAWDQIYAMFGLERSLPKGTEFEEAWHIQETDKPLDTDLPPDPPRT